LLVYGPYFSFQNHPANGSFRFATKQGHGPIHSLHGLTAGWPARRRDLHRHNRWRRVDLPSEGQGPGGNQIRRGAIPVGTQHCGDDCDPVVDHLSKPLRRRPPAQPKDMIGEAGRGLVRRDSRDGLPEISSLHPDRVNVQVGNVDVARAQAFWQQLARIGAGPAMADLIASPMWQGERQVPIADTGKLTR
jgi:hypothetical protein